MNPDGGAGARPPREDLVRAVVLEAYARIRDDGRVADRTLDTLLRREKRLWSSERRAVAERVYGLLRAELPLEATLRAALGPSFERLASPLRHALLYAAMRIREDRVSPAQARAEAGLSPGLQRGLEACAAGAPPEPADRVERLGLRAGLPAWLAARLVADHGDEAEPLALALNQRAPLTIRANRLATDRERLASRLASEGVECRPGRWAPDALLVDTRTNLFGLASFREGLFELQDEGSQLLCSLVDPHAGWTVVDACAGSGGKTLGLAATMKNRGRIWALDSDERRLSELPPRAARAGVHNVERKVVPEGALPGELVQRLGGKADAVLIDSPCSGTGALRRNPDARFRIGPEDVERLSRLQRELFLRYAALAKPGGRVVYATCSVLRAENEAVVEDVLVQAPWLALEPPSRTLGVELAAALGAERYLKLSPHHHGTDGFFAALLVRS